MECGSSSTADDGKKAAVDQKPVDGVKHEEKQQAAETKQVNNKQADHDAQDQRQKFEAHDILHDDASQGFQLVQVRIH